MVNSIFLQWRKFNETKSCCFLENVVVVFFGKWRKKSFEDQEVNEKSRYEGVWMYQAVFLYMFLWNGLWNYLERKYSAFKKNIYNSIKWNKITIISCVQCFQEKIHLKSLNKWDAKWDFMKWNFFKKIKECNQNRFDEIMLNIWYILSDSPQ